MKRDMELCRKILFAIEEQYVDVAIHTFFKISAASFS